MKIQIIICFDKLSWKDELDCDVFVESIFNSIVEKNDQELILTKIDLNQMTIEENQYSAVSEDINRVEHDIKENLSLKDCLEIIKKQNPSKNVYSEYLVFSNSLRIQDLLKILEHNKNSYPTFFNVASYDQFENILNDDKLKRVHERIIEVKKHISNYPIDLTRSERRFRKLIIGVPMMLSLFASAKVINAPIIILLLITICSVIYYLKTTLNRISLTITSGEILEVNEFSDFTRMSAKWYSLIAVFLVFFLLIYTS